MRVLILAVAVLILCGATPEQQAATESTEQIVTIQCNPGWVSTACDQRVPLSWIHIEQPPPAKQEKAQPVGANACLGDKDCKLLPFDLPAKEWDGPDKHAADTCGPPDYNADGTPKMIACGGELIWELNHHVSCDRVASDWRLRSDPIRTGDGKYHCFAFYLLRPNP